MCDELLARRTGTIEKRDVRADEPVTKALNCRIKLRLVEVYLVPAHQGSEIFVATD